MHDRNIGEEVLSGIFIAGWIIILPFWGTWKLARWFVVSTTKEAGNKVVKIVGGAIGIATVAGLLNVIVG
jgi:uncharacterized membrane protein